MKTDQLALFADPNSDAGVLFRAIQHWSPVGLICWEMMERIMASEWNGRWIARRTCAALIQLEAEGGIRYGSGEHQLTEQGAQMYAETA